MAFSSILLLFLVSLPRCRSSHDGAVGYSASHSPPRGCGAEVEPLYRVLCDLEAVWGVVLEAVASGGAVASLALSAVLLARMRSVSEPGRRSGLAPLLLLLATLLGLFSLSLAFLVGRTQALCVLRRALWGPLFALCFANLLVQGLRLRRLVAGKSSPVGSRLAGLAAALALVQGIVSGEWLLLTVVREGHQACDYPPLDFALTCSYTLGLLLTAMGLSLGVVLCGGGLAAEGGETGGEAEGGDRNKLRWRCNGVWLFLSCLASALLWVAWLGFYLYGNQALRARGRGGKVKSVRRGTLPEWDEPALAVALVTQGWILLLFHAIPEAHLCLRSSHSAPVHDYFDTSQALSSSRFGEEPSARPNTHRAYADNQAFSIEEHSAALRGGTYRSGHDSIRPGIPFRGHVYQPTEMALVLNGGTTATHEDVIFVSETVGNPVKIVIDQVKRLALQRDIDKASKASEPSSALGGRAVKNTKNMIVEGNVKKKKGMAKLEQKQEDTPLKKEKKKKKENAPVRAEEASADGEVQVKKKGSKKKLADPVVASESHDAEVLGEDGGSSKKKKKKKGLENGNPETEEHLKVPQSTAMKGKENGQSEGKKKKKTERMSTQSVLEEDRVAVESEGKEEEEVVSVAEVAGQKGKKKKKKGEAGGIVADGQTEAPDGNEGMGPKRKTRKRPAVATDEAETPDVGVEGETEEGVTKTKKKKGKAGVQITTQSNVEVETPRGTKKNSSGKRKGGETPSDTQPQVEEGERKKGKKKKKAAPANEEEEEEAVEVPAKKRGKRKRQPDGAEEEETRGSAKGKKGGKGREPKPAEPASESTPGTAPHRDTGEENADAPVTKRRKKKMMMMIKEEPQSCDDQGTVEFLSEKTGNADEVNIDQNRRLALQREIDQESQPKKPAVQAGLGQWSTAQFDNANQQQKFLRLMGGFKKGAQPMAAGAGRANMALGKEEQQKLQQGLQGEFERAQARRMDFNAKGLGLGFSAPSNKKFSIDVNACKSVRFDD